MSDLNERLIALESRSAYQDDTIESLNATITAQWAAIERLTRDLAALGERLRDAESRAPAQPGDEAPPHY